MFILYPKQYSSVCFSLISTNRRCHKKQKIYFFRNYQSMSTRNSDTAGHVWDGGQHIVRFPGRPRARNRRRDSSLFAFFLSLIIGLKIDSSKHLRRFWQSSNANLEIRGKSNTEWHLLVWPLRLRRPHPCLRTAGNDNLTVKKWWVVKSWFNILLHSCDKGVRWTLMIFTVVKGNYIWGWILAWTSQTFHYGFTAASLWRHRKAQHEEKNWGNSQWQLHFFLHF